MTDDPISDAAAKANLRRAAIAGTTNLIRLRLDPRLIAADVATRVLRRSIKRVTQIETTPKLRKRALIGGGIAVATAIGMRVLYRTAREKALAPPSPETETDVKRLT